jgi:hypothetical protein
VFQESPSSNEGTVFSSLLEKKTRGGGRIQRTQLKLLRMTSVIPIFRIFDYDKAIEFYVKWMGFVIEWEHRFDDSPVYMQVVLKDIRLHLSEHHGDASPGARVFISDFPGLVNYHKMLMEKNYKYNKPGIGTPFYDPSALEMTTIDPFGNRLTFVERNVNVTSLKDLKA